MNHVRNAKLKKVAHGVTVSISEQVLTRGPKFEIAEFLPRSELVGDFAPQSLENFGNIRCGVCSEAYTVLIMLRKSKGVKNGKKER